MTFIWPKMLWALAIVPLLIGGYVWLYRKRQQTAREFGPLSLIQDSSGGKLDKQRHLPLLFYFAGLVLLLFSLSRPEIFIDLPQIEGTVILAFDVSNSMAADDLEPTRMESAKSAARIFVENQPSTIDLGVVAFSNGGFVIQPPSDDQALILDTIDRLSPQGATSLGQGIFSSLNAIAGEAIAIDPENYEEGSDSPDIGHFPSAVILLLTDGENTSSPDPLEIAQLAAEAGVRIYPVGIGSKEGAILEIDGYNVFTQLDEATLQAIADLTNGSYFHAGDNETLREVYQNIDLQLSISGEKTEVTAILAAAGLIFFLIGAAISLVIFGRMPL